MKKRKNNEGNVYYGNTKYIDFDKKPRRRYVIVSDNGVNVKVAKLTSMDEKKKKDKRFLLLKSYPQLPKETGVYNSLYGKNRITKQKLTLGKNNGVFDEKPLFSLDDDDFYKVDGHVIKRGARKKK